MAIAVFSGLAVVVLATVPVVTFQGRLGYSSDRLALHRSSDSEDKVSSQSACLRRFGTLGKEFR